MTQEETIRRLCKLVNEVWQEHDPNAHDPCDCFCADTNIRFQSTGSAVEFVETTVREALAQRKAAAS